MQKLLDSCSAPRVAAWHTDSRILATRTVNLAMFVNANKVVVCKPLK
jgi:hypothetical protein